MEHSVSSSCRDRRQLCNVHYETHTFGSLQTVICMFLFQSTLEFGLEGLEIDVAPNGSPALGPAFCTSFSDLGSRCAFSLGWTGRLEVSLFDSMSPMAESEPWGRLIKTICFSPILKGMLGTMQSPEAHMALFLVEASGFSLCLSGCYSPSKMLPDGRDHWTIPSLDCTWRTARGIYILQAHHDGQIEQDTQYHIEQRDGIH